MTKLCDWGCGNPAPIAKTVTRGACVRTLHHDLAGSIQDCDGVRQRDHNDSWRCSLASRRTLRKWAQLFGVVAEVG